jgi:hypothetical protein
MDSTVIEFISRPCKNNLHQTCDGKWQGLGFEIICSCKCGHKREGNAILDNSTILRTSHGVEGP